MVRRGVAGRLSVTVVVVMLLAGCVSGSSHDPLECAESLLQTTRSAASEAVESMRSAADQLPTGRRRQRQVAQDLRRSAERVERATGAACQ